MGNRTFQQVRVFAMFAAALFMMGFAYTFAAVGNDLVATWSGLAVIAIIVAIITEPRTR